MGRWKKMQGAIEATGILYSQQQGGSSRHATFSLGWPSECSFKDLSGGAYLGYAHAQCYKWSQLLQNHYLQNAGQSKRPSGWENLTTAILANHPFLRCPFQNKAIKIQSPLAFHCRSNVQKQSNLVFHPNKPHLWSYKDKGFPQNSKQQAMQEKKFLNNKGHL